MEEKPGTDKVAHLEGCYDKLSWQVSQMEKQYIDIVNELGSLKSSQTKFETDIMIVKKDLEYQTRAINNIESTMNKVDGKLDKMQETRYDDHLRTPLERMGRAGWVIFGLVASALFGLITKAIGG